MRKHYVLDAARRKAAALAGAGGQGDDEGHGGGPPGRRRLRRVLGGALVVLAAGAFAVWRLWLTPPAAPAQPPTAVVPEHQRTGPLANPWGNEAPVTASRAEEAAAAAAAVAAAAAASAASAAGGGPAVRGGVPPSREAVRQALARLRGAGPAADFANAAMKDRDSAALVVLWMVERQCRQLAHWRQIVEWRTRAAPHRTVATPGPSAAGLALCDSVPEPGLVEGALAAAGFAAPAEVATELTRRPVDFAFAVGVGDPLLLADVLEASDGESVSRQLMAWGVDARDLASPEVQRAALWLASCTPLDAQGRPSGSAALLPVCKEHPAVWQACLHQGLCDVRDLRDLLLRSFSATEMGTVERLARALAPRMGR